MNKQELQNEINKTKEHLANMEKMLAECEYERWKPELGDWYGYLNDYNAVSSALWEGNNIDELRYKRYNCFQTHRQTEEKAEKVMVKGMLEDIARKLNKGKKVDWKDTFGNPWRIKYYISINCLGDKLMLAESRWYKGQGIIYCSNKDFLNVAIQEIGEERLKKYLRGE